MSGLPVAAAKRKLKAKFSYAQGLDDSPLFTDELRSVLVKFQVAKNAANKLNLRTDGVLDWSTQVALGVIAPNPPTPLRKKGVLLSVHGTYVSMWDGYPADTARAVQDLFVWQPVGNFPASAFPMAKSYRRGVEELVVLCRKFAGQRKILAGYSQGAIVTSRVWKYDISSRSGRLWDLRDEFVGAVTWGNPCRELGKANGNKFAGEPVPEGRGITDDRLVSTPEWWLDFAHGGNHPLGRDLYTDVPDDDIGEDCTAIWKIVEGVKVTGVDGLLEQVLEVTRRPLPEAVAMFRAVLYAGAFFGARTGPHVNYSIDGAVKYLRELYKSL